MVINSLSTPHLFTFLDPKSSPMLPLHAYLSFSGFLGWFSLISTSQECYQLPFKTFQQFSFFKQLLTFCVFLFFILGQYILSQVSQKSSLTPLFSWSIIRSSIQDPFNLASLLVECFHSKHTYEHCYAHFLYYHVEIECNTSLISFHDIVLLSFFFPKQGLGAPNLFSWGCLFLYCLDILCKHPLCCLFSVVFQVSLYGQILFFTPQFICFSLGLSQLRDFVLHFSTQAQGLTLSKVIAIPLTLYGVAHNLAVYIPLVGFTKLV